MIKEKEYELNYCLDDEVEAIESFIENACDDNYVCDHIAEVGDDYTPIYNYDVWLNAQKIEEYIDEAKSNGLAEECGIVETIQMGYYQYYTSTIYTNLNNIFYNMIVNYINEYFNNCTEDFVSGVDFEQVEDTIDDLVAELDNNNKFEDVLNSANKLIKEIEDGFYNVT